MSGLEIYGALAATASLVKVAIEVKKHCNKTAEELRALDQAKISALHQIPSLRTVFKSIASSFDSLNGDIVESLSQKDKDDIEDIVKDTKGVIDRSEGIICNIKALTKKKLRYKSGLDELRNELNEAITTIQSLQISLNFHISLVTLRRVNTNRRDSELENLHPPGRQATIDSTWSMQTLTPSFPPESTYSTGSSSGFSSNSPSLTRSTTFVENKQLRSAVAEKDSKRIEQLIRQITTEAEKESWRASALLLACSFRRKSVVQFLLTFNPSVYIIDDFGRGVMHATIGSSEQLSEVQERHTADILELLVNYDSSLVRSKDKQRQQPLHYCARTGNYRAAQYILSVDRGMINTTDSSKKTPLYHICEHHSPNKRLVQLLLLSGGHFETRNRPRMEGVRLAKVKRMLDDEEKKRKLTLPC